MQKLTADEVFCRKIKVDVASHSPQMDPLLDELRAVLAGVECSDPRGPAGRPLATCSSPERRPSG